MKLIWFTLQHSQAIPLSGPTITEKAVKINQKLKGDSNFKVIQGEAWYQTTANQGEKFSADSEIVLPYQEKLRACINKMGFSMVCISLYNCCLLYTSRCV